MAAPDDEDAAIGKELKRRRRLAAANRRAKESSTDESDASVASEEEEGEKAAMDGEKEEEVGAAASPAKATSVEDVASVDGLEAMEEQAGEFVKTADGWEWKGDGSEPSEKVQRSNGGIWGRLCGWGLCGRGSRLEEEDDD